MHFNSSCPLVAWTDCGLYCSQGDFYIDPHRAVKNAVITHAHSDHARRGSQLYFCEASGLGLLRSRLGSRIQVETYRYGEPFQMGDVQVSFHSAGHILGSSQVRIQSKSGVWVVSGDYKRELDPSCEPFEVVACDTFITEATFGTPKYIWDKNRDHGQNLYDWWQVNAKSGKNSVLFGYSLGKAQRILALLAPFAEKPVLIHKSIAELTQCYRSEGRVLAPTLELDSLNDLDESVGMIQGDLILAPPSLLKTEWLNHLGDFETAFASGWMVKPPYPDTGRRGFVISDHADWADLNQTIDDTGAKRVFVLHRSQGALVRHLRKRGVEAFSVEALRPSQFQAIHETNLSLF